MGTRGFLGVVIDGELKLGYQQYDSYPDGVGTAALRDLRELVKDMDDFKAKARALRVVDDSTPPTRVDIERLAKFTDLGVSEQSTDDWYCLTRGTHGELAKILECGYVNDTSTFPLDSLFCEWGYLVDLDTGVFEAYEGFQKSPPKEGRWAGQGTGDYYAVELAGNWLLDGLPTDGEFVDELMNNEE